jgi:hypothetical protein
MKRRKTGMNGRFGSVAWPVAVFRRAAKELEVEDEGEAPQVKLVVSDAKTDRLGVDLAFMEQTDVVTAFQYGLDRENLRESAGAIQEPETAR